jgi:hypothetical protein
LLDEDQSVDVLSVGLATLVGASFVQILNLIINSRRLPLPVILAPEFFEGLDREQNLGLRVWSDSEFVRVIKQGYPMKGLGFYWDSRLKSGNRAEKESALLEYCQKLSGHFPDIPLIPPKANEVGYDEAPPTVTSFAAPPVVQPIAHAVPTTLIAPIVEQPQLNYAEIQAELKELRSKLGWDQPQTKAHIARNFSGKVFSTLTDADLIQFLNQLRLLVNPKEAVMATLDDDLPF